MPCQKTVARQFCIRTTGAKSQEFKTEIKQFTIWENHDFLCPNQRFQRLPEKLVALG